MFNKENGELKIGTTIVSPSLTLAGFLLTLLSQNIIDKQTLRENIIFILNPQWVKESFFNVRLSFLSSTKSLFLIELRNSYDGLYPLWLFENWSENDEKKIKGEHDFWLFQIFGKPHEFVLVYTHK